MAIGNWQIATMGWYTSAAGVFDGEEVHTLGWFDGTVVSTAGAVHRGRRTNREWPIIPKRNRHRR